MKKFGNVLWGIVLIGIGLIIGGNALGITNINVFFDGWWTLFIIIPCFIGLFKDNEKTGNLIGLLIGVVLLLACQDILSFDLIWKLAFPTILVIIGISIIFKDTIGGKVNSEIKKLNEKRSGENGYCATFSGQDINFAGEKFTGADLTAVFGGVKCDLRNAIIESDVVINASSTFGGIEIYVPSNVEIKIKSNSIFGGVSNKANTKPSENSYTIYINGAAVFGGVEVK
ncbi:MAG: LiaF transmembrane domain-containing protein [Clostridia bacterium]